MLRQNRGNYMKQSEKQVKTSKRNFVLALALLLLTNALMGFTLTSMSKKTLRQQMNQHMLDVANAAARQLNGDELGSLNIEDKGNDAYNNALEILLSFQDSIKLDYIYGVRQESDGSFTFTIDPADDPAEFGQPVQSTKALRNAANGKADVDKEAHTDEWGRFYSAYSPVFDSQGNVGGIVGVDFDANWYDGKLDSHRAVIIILSAVTMLLGIVLSFIILSQNRKRFAKLLTSLNDLEKEMNKLDSRIVTCSVEKLNMLPSSESELLKTLASGEDLSKPRADEYETLYTGIEGVYNKFERYMKYMESSTHQDDITNSLNKIAYKEKIIQLDKDIESGYASFSVAFFDINGLKRIYVEHGFDEGETLLYNCSKILRSVYGNDSVYHVTGDEFIVLEDYNDTDDMKAYFSAVDSAIEKYNETAEPEKRLSVAKGSATYKADKYSSYREVFKAAKTACDADKALYYEKKMGGVQEALFKIMDIKKTQGCN